MEGSGAQQLREALERATENERRRAVAVAAAVRASGALVFFALSTVIALATDKRDWEVIAPLLGGYFALAAGLFLLRQRPIATRLAWLAALIDVGAVFLIQREALPVSPFPAGVAGFSMGPLAVLIALSSLTLQWRAIYVTAAAATVAEIYLQQMAGVDVGAMISAGLIFFLMAAVSHAAVRRLRYMAVDLVESEVGRQLEARRMTELGAATRTIERMLVDSRAQNERLERLQRDKDSLVQLIVHDLRTPLNAIMLSIEYLAQHVAGKRDSAEAAQAVDDVRTTSQRLAGMVAQILDTSRLEEGRLTLQPAPVVAAELFERVRRQIGAMPRDKGVELAAEAPDGLTVWGDGRLLARVMENLVSNAIRHAPSASRVLMLATPDAGGCRLSVHNNGPPVDPAERERVFDKFHQGRGDNHRLGGWGLGLYFCRMVAETHGGRIAIEEVDGWLTSFVVRLPDAAAAVETDVAAAGAS